MSEPALTAFLAELTAAEAVFAGLIKGNTALLATGLGQQSTMALQANEVVVTRRHDLIVAAITALNALDADGYPANPPEVVDPFVIHEIQGTIAAINAAMAQLSD